MSQREKKYEIAVIGAGNGGQAIAGHLAMQGHGIRLYDINLQKLSRITETGGIVLTGEIEGFGRIKTITSNIFKAVKNADIIMVATTADAHRNLAYDLASIVKDGQIIMLNPGRTLGAYEFRYIFQNEKVTKKVYLVETQSLVYACRSEVPGNVRIIGYKDNVYYASLPSIDNIEVKKIITSLYESFQQVENVLVTSLENFGAIFHTVIVLTNASKIERGEDFYFYNDITPRVCSLLEKVDNERILLAKAFGIKVKSAENWISFAYKNIEGKDLLSKMQHNPAYYKIMAPKTLFSRLLLEDIPTGILPMIELSSLANIELPLMKAIYEFSANLLGIDFKMEGRTLKNLGLSHFSTHEFLDLL